MHLNIMMRKILLFIMAVAVITTGFLFIKHHPSSNVITPPDMRTVHNFKMLAKTLGTSRKTPHNNFGDSLRFNNFDTHVLSSTSSDEKVFPQDSSEIDKLSDIFKHKMSKVTLEVDKMKPVCHNPDVIANSCENNQCLQTSFPTELRERLRQIVEPKKLQVSAQHEKVLDSMARRVKGGQELMIVSGTSSNHFLETQALIRNLHENIYQHFNNFTFVLYNLGLTPTERKQMVSFCNCQVIDFPFDKFPGFVSKKLCYSFKPVIVRAHIDQADIVMWIDASIRFDKDPSYFSSLLKRTKKKMMQIAFSRAVSPFRTYRSMYHYFGDEPCMYLNMGQVQSGIDMFRNEFFVKRAVLDPWAACALTQSCMCPLEEPIKSCAESHQMTDAWRNKQGPIVYGLCHRYDQSSLSIILHKLYQNAFRWVTFDVSRYIVIKRKDKDRYFESFS